jgi:hypothetical protein
MCVPLCQAIRVARSWRRGDLGAAKSSAGTVTFECVLVVVKKEGVGGYPIYFLLC